MHLDAVECYFDSLAEFLVEILEQVLHAIRRGLAADDCPDIALSFSASAVASVTISMS